MKSSPACQTRESVRAAAKAQYSQKNQELTTHPFSLQYSTSLGSFLKNIHLQKKYMNALSL